MRKLKICFYLSLLFLLYTGVYAQEMMDAVRKGNLSVVKEIIAKDPWIVTSQVLHNAVIANKMDIAECLISNGADMNEPAGISFSFPPLAWAIKNDNMEMVKMFFKKGANIQFKTWLGETYLHLAALWNKKNIADFFIANGIDINILKAGGLTPLHIAAVSGSIDVVKLLVQKGADLNLKSSDGATPLHYALAAGENEIANYLKQNGVEIINREFPVYKGEYLGNTKPGNASEVFAPDLFLKIYRPHGQLTFSPDGKEVYWVATFMLGGLNRIWFMKQVDGIWQAPLVAPFSMSNPGSPAFAFDGNRIFFTAKRDNKGEAGSDTDLWYADRIGDGWGEPKHIGMPVSEPGVYELHPFTAKDGSVYFIKNGKNRSGIFKSSLSNNTYSEPVSLGNLFESSNTDESKEIETIIVDNDSERKLYAAFHKPDGKWSKPAYLGDDVHKGRRVMLGRITIDGKYIFCLMENYVYYWVSTDILKNLK